MDALRHSLNLYPGRSAARIVFLLSLLCTLLSVGHAQDLDITKQSWMVWLDEEAKWKSDTLFMPGEFQLESLPVNAPSCGWDSVYTMGKPTRLPAVVEELFSGGDARWTYHGVSWFTTTVDIPRDWKNKLVHLDIGKKNRRLEIYVNGKLAGYDLVAAAPYACDISEFLMPGEANRIAFRITNPGGARGWGDFPLVSWGDVKLPPGRDFGGIAGDLILHANDPVYIEDLFVKNLPPAMENRIEVQLQLKNECKESRDIRLDFSIGDATKLLYSETIELHDLDRGDSLLCFPLQIPGALAWDINNPNLYSCKVQLRSGEYSDDFVREFGFRVFEVRANEAGEENFYLNGKRFRHRSAIDWSFYAHLGYYPSEEMAEKSIQNAKDIGHNGINCHRHMADEGLLAKADQLGLLIFEEPGGFDSHIAMYTHDAGLKYTSEGKLMRERCLRMAKRDRHHPSVAAYILSNEREVFDLLRKNLMIDMHAIDDSKLIVNQSGGDFGGPSGHIPHLRPYEPKFRLDYMDDHTVSSEEKFMEFEFFGHQGPHDRYSSGRYGRIDPMAHDNIVYWGEVRCYTGPDNWYELIQQAPGYSDERRGYNQLNSAILAEKTESYFIDNALDAQEGSKILSPEDLSVQAGRGLMYSNGRLGQIIMSNNSEDGYAINGWSGGSSILPPGNGPFLEWYSAMCDEGRNLKGPASDLAYWVRPLQLAIFRMNGKYFEPGDTIRIKVDLINEGLLAAGEYSYRLRVLDGNGQEREFLKEGDLTVKGGDCFAQPVLSQLEIPVSPDWQAGYITIEAELRDKATILADGHEQVLLRNRASYMDELEKRNIAVFEWPAAGTALAEAGYPIPEPALLQGVHTILAGAALPLRKLKSCLKEVEHGALMVIRFDSLWAERLWKLGILEEQVREWGGRQDPFWNGNGWGYISGLPGAHSLPGGGTIGTNAWEVPGDPLGFAPFKSAYPQSSYGAWFARPDVLLTLFGEIKYGEGHILLAPSYPLDEDHAFNDLLFFNMLSW